MGPGARGMPGAQPKVAAAHRVVRAHRYSPDTLPACWHFSNETGLCPRPCMPDHKHQPPLTARVPRTVWALGFVSMLMDVSSEIVQSLLPLFLVSTLGGRRARRRAHRRPGGGDGVRREAFLWRPQRLGRQAKTAGAVGYGLSALTKPVFATASSVGWVVAARVTDRVGRGIRGAPRDALVADVTPRALLSLTLLGTTSPATPSRSDS